MDADEQAAAEKEWRQAELKRQRAQAVLDHLVEQQRILNEPLDDGYVTIGGFREPRYRMTCHKGRGDPDWGMR
jgi:hypothetical protein